MIRTTCPFCGEENLVGPFPEKQPGERPVTMRTCPHFVFAAVTDSPVAEYVHKELYVEFGHVPGSYSLEEDVMRILRTHFKFFGPVAFAPSESAREDARREVKDFLRARGINVPMDDAEKEDLVRWANKTPPGTVPQADRERFEKIRQKMILDMPSLPAAGGPITQHWVGVTDDDFAFLDWLRKRLERERGAR